MPHRPLSKDESWLVFLAPGGLGGILVQQTSLFKYVAKVHQAWKGQDLVHMVNT